MKQAFWIFLSLLAYTWCGYPLLLALCARLFPRPGRAPPAGAPPVTVLLTVHNEEKEILGRIANILDSDYPAERLELLVASDGSDDQTDARVEEAARADKRVRLLSLPREGKSGAQNLAVPQAAGEIVVLTDAGARFDRDTIGALVEPFADARVGCVSGKLVLLEAGGGVARSQGLYWRFELMLRSLESRLGLLHTASGPVMAFRKNLFRKMPREFGDDCVIPLDILARGFRIVHADRARAYDSFPASIAGELRARIRMTLRNITGTLTVRSLLNPFRRPLVAGAIVSHKILRWLTPYLWLGLFGCNTLLLRAGAFYGALFAGQLALLAAGGCGFLAERRGRRVPVASPVFSFMLANAGFFIGVWRAALGAKITTYRSG